MENKKESKLSYKDLKIGALWEKKSKNGNTYYSGNIMINGQEHYINIMKNKYYQENTKRPIYDILLSILNIKK
ncbi:DUF736 domain-containing protein [bacterium]|jgi:hypothetical protein|nr:DUF736 domain-containing protein [bacterium]